MENKECNWNSYISKPLLVGSGINIVLFIALWIDGFLIGVILIDITYAVIAFIVKSLKDKAKLIVLGAISGLIGAFACGSIIKDEGFEEPLTSWILMLYIAMLSAPHLVYFIVALREKKAMAEQECQERERWEYDIARRIDDIFSDMD